MLSYKKIFIALCSSALLFHTLWVIPAFIRYPSNNIARTIFEIVHPGAKYGTLQGYFVSDFWITVYCLSASLIFVYFYNLTTKLKD